MDGGQLPRNSVPPIATAFAAKKSSVCLRERVLLLLLIVAAIDIILAPPQFLLGSFANYIVLFN